MLVNKTVALTISSASEVTARTVNTTKKGYFNYPCPIGGEQSVIVAQHAICVQVTGFVSIVLICVLMIVRKGAISTIFQWDNTRTVKLRERVFHRELGLKNHNKIEIFIEA